MLPFSEALVKPPAGIRCCTTTPFSNGVAVVTGSLTNASLNGNMVIRSEEHTSELQSRLQLVCRLLLEKKKHSGSQFLFLDAELEGLLHPIDLTGVPLPRVHDPGPQGLPYEEFLAAGPPDVLQHWLRPQ